MRRVRSRPALVIVGAATIALALGACTSTATSSDDVMTDAAGSATPWSDDCPDIEHPPLQLGSHLIGDAAPPQDYSSIPPTSGWHRNQIPEAGMVHADELDDAQIVAAIETGIVVVAMAPGVDTAGLDELVAQFPDRVLATTYSPAMTSPVALLTWGTVARCDQVTATDVTTFVLTERVVPDGH